MNQQDSNFPLNQVMKAQYLMQMSTIESHTGKKFQYTGKVPDYGAQIPNFFLSIRTLQFIAHLLQIYISFG